MLRTEKELECTSGMSIGTLNWLRNSFGRYYRTYDKHIRTLRGIKVRKIIEPKGILKDFQDQVSFKLLTKVEFPEYVQGGIKGRSQYSNALMHVGNSYFFSIDIKLFYESITATMVNHTLLDHGFSNDNARIVTRLITYDNQLPKGSSTSPYIANMFLLPLDRKLIGICDKYDITYSRFVDDLQFSSNKDFRHLTAEIIGLVRAFKMTPKRNKIKYRNGKAEITGIMVDSKGLGMIREFKRLLANPAKLTKSEYSFLLSQQKRIEAINRELSFLKDRV